MTLSELLESVTESHLQNENSNITLTRIPSDYTALQIRGLCKLKMARTNTWDS